MRLDHLSFAAGPDGLAGTAQRIGGLLGNDVRRRRRAPAVRHPQHDPAARRPHLPRGRRGARPPGLRQGAVRPGRARPLRPRRRLARLGRRGRRHRGRRAPARPRVRGRQPAPPRRHRAALEADRRQRPDRRPAAAVLHRVGRSRPTCTRAPAPTATSPWPAWRSPATRSASASGSARPSRRRSRTSRSSGSPPTARPGIIAVAGPDARTASSGSEPWTTSLPEGARPSPNIWHHPRPTRSRTAPSTPTAALEAAMPRARRWAGRDVLDLGCGTGFHLPRFAATAASVVGVEPHPDLVALARRRTRRLPNVDRATRAPPRRCRCRTRRSTSCTPAGPTSSGPAASRAWPSSTASYAAAARRSSIDNDPTRSTFGAWFRRGYPKRRPGRGRAVLVDPRLDPDAGRHGLAVLLARRPRGRRTHRVRRAPPPTRSWPSTRAPRSTTPSTCGRSALSRRRRPCGRSACCSLATESPVTGDPSVSSTRGPPASA